MKVLASLEMEPKGMEMYAMQGSIPDVEFCMLMSIETNKSVGLSLAEWVAEATMESVTKKCSGGTSNRRDPAPSEDFRDQEEEMERDNGKEEKEDASNRGNTEERKHTVMPLQGPDRDPNEEKDVKESDNED
ncbi:hypothetical protein NDU88_001805 [Pleurodeles waltl]|uniref:Uncharacterized protein n=1 Tax=Pleurodeles waltl TaxID=8319 RepID=A0AAV7RCN1_PLEWA|nr:hypothetical protein NDU88_001805 [Pleurodeles waltl]